MSNNLGLYIHIPFCRSKCPYCDFFSMRASESDYFDYVCALKEKIAHWSEKLDKTVDTIYLGGGTPSVLGAELICDIISCVKENFKVSENAEITMEANPASGKFFDFNAAAEVGVNRISIGLQSAVENELKTLGRLHNTEDVKSSIELIRNAGINNISLDLMMGIPYQTIETLKKSIDFCVQQNVQHISSYILKIENGTVFDKKRDKYVFPDEDECADLYLFAVEYLKEKGYNQYEISNFSKKGFESKHNLKYWKLYDYLGIGAAAHSFVDGKRFYYDRSIDKFKQNIIISDGVGGNVEEQIMLGLRLMEGIDIKNLGEEISESLVEKSEKYRKAGLMTLENGRLSLTAKGFLVSNSIISDLI